MKSMSSKSRNSQIHASRPIGDPNVTTVSGIRLLPANRAAAEAQALAGCLGLLVVGTLPTLIGLTGQVYLFGALMLGVGLLGCGVLDALWPSLGAARRLLFASLLYLPTLLVLMTLDKS